MVLNTEWAQVEVIDLVNDGSGLAFGIIGGRSTGVVVKTILPGGVADRDGRLQSGDHILQIGEVNLRGLGSEQVASVLRQCGVHVRLVVARPVESASGDYQMLESRAPIVPTKILGDPVELDRHLIENGYAEVFTAPPPSTNYETPFIYTGRPSELQLHPISGIVDVVRDPLPIGIVQPPQPPTNPPLKLLPLDMALREPALPETEVYNIQLKKDDLGLGITVAGYVCEKEEISGIFVKSISKGSAADLTRKIKVNDRIIEVDGQSVLGCTNHEAVKILKNTSTTVTLTLERYLRGPKYEQLQQAIKANELRRPSSPPSPSFTSLPKVPLSLVQMESLTIEPDPDSRTSIDFDSTVFIEAPSPVEEEKEIVIDNRKTVKFNLFDSESLQEKWKGKLNGDAKIIVAEIVKEPNLGLGISLEGTVDVEDGVEVRPRHYIRNILPDGPVGRSKLLQSGDELLEVNGIQLMGLNHLDVVTTLKQLPSVVNLTCARYPVPIRIINTAQHREAFEERNILGESLHNIIPPNDLVKAKSDTSIASSVASELCGSGGGVCSRSRSLEAIAGLPMWSDTITTIELVKGDRGLGFSILDYQDPLNSAKTVIVIRSLIPGGVAQIDGRLIPGDKLVAVNDAIVEHATLDEAVRVLKGAPKGTVKLMVAKPINNDSGSYTSQWLRKILQEWSQELATIFKDTDQEDQTCLDEFQECLEEYQECLEVVQICMYEDTSFKSESHSDVNGHQIVLKTDTKPNNNLLLLDNHQNNKIGVRVRNDSSTQSVRTDEKDGYETCIDESLSEDVCCAKTTPTNQKNHIETNQFNKTDDIVQITNKLNYATSEPCLIYVNRDSLEIFLDSKHDELKSYDHQPYDSIGTDEFFLIQYPPDHQQMNNRCRSEPTVYEQCFAPDKSYIRRLEEYYNDYEHCLEHYRVCDNIAEETNDDDIFRDVVVPVRSSSAPDVLDSSFVTLTYDPGPCTMRRKSVFVGGYEQQNSDGVSMTIIAPIEDGIVRVNGTNVNSIMLQKHWGSTRSVQVYREPNKSLGISIVGGKVDLYTPKAPSKAVLGIFVKNVVQDSPAGRTGQFKTGDRILEVSGRDLTNLNHEEAVEIIRNAPNPVTFLIQSLLPWTDEREKDQVICSPNAVDVNLKSAEKQISEEKREVDEGVNDEKTSLAIEEQKEVTIEKKEDVQKPDKEIEGSSDEEEESDEEDVRELEGRTVSAKGMEIDRASAANLRRSQEEIDADPEEEDDFGYTENKVKKKYASLGHSVLMVQLERGCQGLGLSLAGHKDRNCMAVFVCGLNPKGAAYRTGGIQVGDEILEVNGVVLHGRCHLNASAIIKGLSGPVFKVIILRRKTAIDDIAVKPITQFPISLAEEAPEEQYSNYPNVRTVTVKKGAQSLGIMIIEGKHAEVGQGIFISDLQEGSAAEKAGLEIGEMILAVNKDSLLGSNYETAANLLKRTEGLVTLVVSNPSKRVPTPTPSAADAEKSAALKPTAPPSRPATPTPEPVADPSSCLIVPGKETTIEIVTDNKSLGLYFVGGKDTLIASAIVILEVYPGGTADKDGRLKPGDQIVEVNGVSMKDVSHSTASQALRQTLPKMKLIVYRPEQIDYTIVDVDLVKKSGKGLGISVIARKDGKGVYISEIIGGGAADVDGRIMKGDILVSVNGQSVENCSGEEAGAILKTVTGKVSLKLHRYKPTVR